MTNQTLKVKMKHRIKFHIGRGAPHVWICGAATAAVLLMFLIMIFVVARYGLSAFWTPDYHTFTMRDGSRILGAIAARETETNKTQLYIANREFSGLDFVWIDNNQITSREQDADVVVLERMGNGKYIGWIAALATGEQRRAIGGSWPALEYQLTLLKDEAGELERLKKQMASISLKMERLRLRVLRQQKEDEAKARETEQKRQEKLQEFETLNARASDLTAKLRQNVVVMVDASGQKHDIALLDIVKAYRPNHMGLLGKSGLYMGKVYELLTDFPRESNTEGGLFPAIMGTVMMVMLMSLFGVPLGVLTGIYLSEYARQSILVNLVRITVNNLAGVPSIVYGMFGLGLFVYGFGGAIDQWFFPERLPMPTYGTDGLLWAALTMALLTVPVVIVSTQEGLESVPKSIRDGSQAMGATRFQTLTRVVLPMASPGILTGLILAIARAAGEVAPLMLVGVVKMAPSLPLDGTFPYLHLDRKIMHLGFHIYDVGFQSPNAEAAKPMVFVTTLLLLAVVLGMSIVAMYLRNKMKTRYNTEAF